MFDGGVFVELALAATAVVAGFDPGDDRESQLGAYFPALGIPSDRGDNLYEVMS